MPELTERGNGLEHLNGQRMHRGFLAGASAVIRARQRLNRINVFPVPDGDTGSNLAATMRTIIAESQALPTPAETLRAIADCALAGSRGNSGAIVAQYLYGLSRELPTHTTVSTSDFALSAQRAVDYATRAVTSPVEGTILTVMREWASSFDTLSKRYRSFLRVLHLSTREAERALERTPEELPLLAEAGVVDAGGLALVEFLNGVLDFIRTRGAGADEETWEDHIAAGTMDELPSVTQVDAQIDKRYCLEAVVEECSVSPEEVRGLFDEHTDSVVVAGDRSRLHLHVHSDRPELVMPLVSTVGRITAVHADDMRRQAQVTAGPRHDIALVTDTACDLPAELLDRYQIHQIPFSILFGDNQFIDRVTLQPSQFYTMLAASKTNPTSAQPSDRDVLGQYEFLCEHYRHVVAIHIAGALSGMIDRSRQAAARLSGRDIRVLDSRQLSGSLGLVVMRAAEAIEQGRTVDEVVAAAEQTSRNAGLLVDVNTLKYMVRGGRVPPLTGLVAKLLNIKPIVTLDENGKGLPFGRSFTRRANMRRILGLMGQRHRERSIERYCLVHAHAEARALSYAEQLEACLGFPPAYTMEIAPVIGVHNGTGAVAVAYVQD